VTGLDQRVRLCRFSSSTAQRDAADPGHATFSIALASAAPCGRIIGGTVLEVEFHDKAQSLTLLIESLLPGSGRKPSQSPPHPL